MKTSRRLARLIAPTLLLCALPGCFFGGPDTPLGRAADGGDLAAMTALLDQGADPHRECGVNGWTPLLHALHKDQKAAAERLIATCTAPSAELDDALFMAAGYAQADAVAALMERGANPQKDFGDGANALSNAVSGAFDIDFGFRGCAAHTATVRALLAGTETKLQGRAGTAARRAAERRDCAEMVTLLDGSQASQGTVR